MDVVRRYSDFEWLASEIKRTYPGVVIPILPSKSILFAGVSTNSLGIDSVDDRRFQFELFLRQLVLRHNSDADNFFGFSTLLHFLTAPDEEMKSRNFQQLSAVRTMSDCGGGVPVLQNHSIASSSPTAEGRQSRSSWISSITLSPSVSKVVCRKYASFL